MMNKIDLSRVKITYDECFPPMIIIEKEKKNNLIHIDDARYISEDEAMEIINRLSHYLLKEAKTNQVLLASNKIEITIRKRENNNE